MPESADADFDIETAYLDAKRAYFQHVAQQFRPAMRMLIQGGNLRVDRKKDERWKGGRGTVEHCIAQIPAISELAKLCGLNDDEVKTLATHAAVHNWDKGFELDAHKARVKYSDDGFYRLELQSIAENRRAAWKQYAPALSLKRSLLNATKPQVHKLYTHSSFEQRLLFYVDDLFDGSQLTDPLDRIGEVEARRQELNDDPRWNVDGRNYWQQERHMIEQTQGEIFDRMKKHSETTGIPLPITHPNQIPDFLRTLITERIMDFAETQLPSDPEPKQK